jgi:hypothetical protein
MARGVSTKLKAGLPAGYRAGWLEKLDRRTRVARTIMQRIAILASDAGGADVLSHAQQSLIKRAVFLEAITESHELRFAAGEQIDVGAYTQALNSMLGVYRILGIERRARNVPNLSDYLRQREGDRAASQPIVEGDAA